MLKLKWTINNNGYQAKVGPWKALVEADGMRRGKPCCGIQPASKASLEATTLWIASFTGTPDQRESGFTSLEEAQLAAEQLAEMAIFDAATALDLV